jgi:MFS family permease
MDTGKQQKNSMARIGGNRDFRLLFTGASTSLLGDQFALIATPWLVLRLTGDPLALGVVLALEGIPRALFMLLGGAVTDRISPRLVMIVSDVARFVLTAWMGWVVLTGSVQMWMLYAFGLGFGLVAGFAIPAENSILPMLLGEQDLQVGNSIVMGTNQLVGFVGPTLAGILIAQYAGSPVGLGLAFTIDAISFAISAAAIWAIRGVTRIASTVGQVKESVWASIVAGIQFIWRDPAMRLMFIALTLLNFLLVGPLLVGIPLLANQRLAEGAAAFGLLMSGYAGGNLIGYLASGFLPRPSGLLLRLIMIVTQIAFGVVLMLLGVVPYTWLDFILMLGMGLGNGYIGLMLFTWMQNRTPKEMLGRVMSLVVLSNVGLVPVSQAISGVVSKWDLALLFMLAGALILITTLWVSIQPAFGVFSESMANSEAAADPKMSDAVTGIAE